MTVSVNSRTFNKTNNSDANDVEEVEAALDVLHGNDEDLRDEINGIEDGTVAMATPAVSSYIKTDEIRENSTNAGITIDSTLIKDNTVTATTFIGAVSGWVPTGYITGMRPSYTDAATTTYAAGTCANGGGTTPIIFSAAKTISLASSGAGGLDTGSEATSTWYYPYAIQKSSDGTSAAIASVTNEANTGSITYPTDYDTKRQLRFAIKNDGSGDIIPFYMASMGEMPQVIYDVTMAGAGNTVGATNVLDGGGATSYTNVDLSAYVPPISTLAILKFSFVQAGDNAVSVRPDGSSHDGYEISSGTANSKPELIAIVRTSSSQVIEYKRTGSGSTVDITVVGYIVTEV